MSTIALIVSLLGTFFMIYLSIDLINQWKNSSKSTRTSSDLVIQWFFWLTIILLIVVSL